MNTWSQMFNIKEAICFIRMNHKLNLKNCKNVAYNKFTSLNSSMWGLKLEFDLL